LGIGGTYMAKRIPSGEIQYLNTDLDLTSSHDLTALADAFKNQGVYCLHVTRGDDSLWHAALEADVTSREPESSIAALVTIIETLDRPERRLWRSCTEREFNIGYDCGREPWGFNQRLSNQLMGRIVKAGASLRITLYPPGRIVRAKKSARRKQ
jgi:hypothetical protein